MGWLTSTFDNIFESVFSNPFKYIAQIAGSFFGIPPYVTAAAVTAIEGGSLLDIAKSAAMAYAGSELLSSAPSSQWAADIKNYTINSWVGDFTDSMMQNFNLAPDQAVQLAKISSNVLNSTIAGGIKAALTGGSIENGISSGITSGLINFSTNSFFDSVNQDANWGLSQQALNLMKGSTSAALNTFISGKGDPLEAAGAYIANAALTLAGSAFSSGIKDISKLMATDTDAAKAAQDNFVNLKAELDNKIADGEKIRTSILNDSEEYQRTINERFLPFKEQHDNLIAQNEAAANDFNTNKQIYDENKALYLNYDAEMMRRGYVGYGEEGGGGYRLVGATLGDDGEGGRVFIPDGSIRDDDGNPSYKFVYDPPPTRESFLTATNNAAAAASSAYERYTATKDAAQSLYENNKSMIDGLAEARTRIETKVADLQKIRDDVENPNADGTNLAAKVTAAANDYQSKYDAWAKTKEAADRYAENYTKALAEAATRNATIDALKAGVIQVTGRDADGNLTLSNNMTLTNDGKFMQDGKLVFAKAEGLPQNALNDFGDGGGGGDEAPTSGGKWTPELQSRAVDYIRNQLTSGNRDFQKYNDGTYSVDDAENNRRYIFGSDGSYLGSSTVITVIGGGADGSNYVEPKTSQAAKDFLSNLYAKLPESDIYKNPYGGESEAQTPLAEAETKIRGLIGFGDGNPDSKFRALFGGGSIGPNEWGLIGWGTKEVNQAVTWLDAVIEDPKSSQEDIRVAQQAKEKITQAAVENRDIIAQKDSAESPPVTPTPVEPPPVTPTPIEPTPVPPTPVEPTPVKTATVEPTTPEPAPVTPAPTETTPVAPTATAPTQGASTAAAPTETAPTTSTNAAPTESAPTPTASTTATPTPSSTSTAGSTPMVSGTDDLIKIYDRINSLMAQGLSNQQATEQAIKETQGQIANLGSSVDSRIKELVAQGLNYQQATQQAIKETQGQITNLGSQVNDRINELTQQGLNYQQATEQAIKEVQGQVTQTKQDLGGQITQTREGLESKISDTQGQINARVDELMRQGQDFQTATNTAINEVKAQQDAAAAAVRAKEAQAKTESNLAKALSLTSPSTAGTEESTPFKKIGLKTTGEAKFEGPLDQYLKMVKGTNYGQKPAEAQQQNQQQNQQGANMQQDLLTPQPGQTQPVSDYFSYGQQTDIDRMLTSTQSPEMGILQSKAGGLATPLMAAGGNARYGRYAGGGLNIVEHSGKRRLDFRRGDAVTGPGDGQSDDIPAMLADGEFVFPADVVAALGNGSTKAGSDKLYDMMHSIRAYHRSADPQDLPPPAKNSPLDYLKKRKARR